MDTNNHIKNKEIQVVDDKGNDVMLDAVYKATPDDINIIKMYIHGTKLSIIATSTGFKIGEIEKKISFLKNTNIYHSLKQNFAMKSPDEQIQEVVNATIDTSKIKLAKSIVMMSECISCETEAISTSSDTEEIKKACAKIVYHEKLISSYAKIESTQTNARKTSSHKPKLIVIDNANEMEEDDCMYSKYDDDL